MQRAKGFLLLLCVCYSQLSDAATSIDEHVSPALVIQADDLFSSLKILSEQTGVGVFFASALANISTPFNYTGAADLDTITQLIATHYQVNIERLEGSLLVTTLADEPTKNHPKINSTTRATKIAHVEEVIVSAPAMQAKMARGYEVNSDAHPEQSVRVESLSLMNAASYATNNLADSLLNIAGIAASYDSGEARQVAMRGLNGDFIHVALNGMQTLAIHGSSLDSREQDERALAFDFNVLPSELFERVDIAKEYSVAQDSGGIAGNINLYTSDISQLVDDQYQLNGMLEYSQTDFVDNTTSRAAFSWQYKQQHWFYMLGASVNNKVTQEQGYNTYRWQQLNIANTDASQLSTALQQKLQAQEIYFPRGNRYSVWLNNMTQQGVTGALHYYNDHYHHKLDWLYAALTNHKQEYHLATRGLSTTALSADNKQPSKISQLIVDEHDYLRFAQFEHAQIATESRQLNKNTQFAQLTWQGAYQFSPKWQFDWLLGGSQNELTVPSDEKVFLKSFTELTTDYSEQFAFPSNSYGMDLLASEQWHLDEIDIQAKQSLIAQKQANINFSYQDDASRWQLGLQYKSFLDERNQQQRVDLYKNEFNTGLLDNQLDDTLSQAIYYHQKIAWLGINNRAVAKRYMADISLTNSDTLLAQSYRLARTNSAAWLQYNYQQADYSIGIGARIEHFREQVSQALSSNKIQHRYFQPLFSANFRYAINANWQTRFNVSENLTPVQTKYVNPAQQYLPAIAGYEKSSNKLSAYKSKQFSAQLIGNINAQTQLVSSVYFKQLSGLINYQQVVNDNVTVYQRVNQASAFIKGIDIDLTYQWHPHVSINATYSYADSERDYRFAELFNYTGQLEGLSKQIARFSLDYHRQNWGSRLLLNYRSGYMSEINYQRLWVDQLETGFLPYKRINWSSYIALSDELEVNVGVNNLSNEYYREYAGQHHALYNTTQAGRQYYLRFILMW